jgi:hypothetical protein
MTASTFIEWLRYTADARQLPEPGMQPARFTYFTVDTADGKRCVSLDLTPTTAARDAQTSGRPTGGANSDDRES